MSLCLLSGTVAIYSYVAPELCNATAFYNLSVQGGGVFYTVMITYNGVGTITTESRVIPIVSNRYTIDGPGWTSYEDYSGDISNTYTGTNPQAGPYTFAMTGGYAPCGTPFATVINDQFGTVTLPQCNTAGNVQGWFLETVAFGQDQCLGNGITDAQFYVDVGVDESGNPAITVELVVYYF